MRVVRRNVLRRTDKVTSGFPSAVVEVSDRGERYVENGWGWE